MYQVLATDTIHRSLSVADLNIPDPPGGGDPLMAAPLAATAGAVGAGARGASLPAAPQPVPFLGDARPAGDNLPATGGTAS